MGDFIVILNISMCALSMQPILFIFMQQNKKKKFLDSCDGAQDLGG